MLGRLQRDELAVFVPHDQVGQFPVLVDVQVGDDLGTGPTGFLIVRQNPVALGHLVDPPAVIELDHTGLSNQNRERDSSAKRDNVSVAYGLMPAARAGTLTLTRVKNRLNYPGDDAITLQRVTEPVLTHTTGDRVDPEILAALRELDKANVPLTAGRDTAREALKAAGVSIGNNVLAAAIRLRKAELEG